MHLLISRECIGALWDKKVTFRSIRCSICIDSIENYIINNR